MSLATRGVIVNYRVGPRSQTSKECIVQFVNVSSVSEASRFIGRKIVYKDEDKRIVGKIVALHGKKGLVRVRFRKGVPGQALGATVDLAG